MSKKQLNVIAIVQARMGSTRLPGKHLKEVLGRPLLSFLIERLKRANSLQAIVLATTIRVCDDELAALCEKEHILCFRGSEEDVLGRFALAADIFQADVVVRICADCPLMDPAVVDEVVRAYLEAEDCDIASNVVERTYPRGMDVEVFSASALKIAAHEASHPEEREHVTPFFYRHPQRFHLKSVAYHTNQSQYRWTVDTEEDFRLVSYLIQDLYPLRPEFTLEDLLLCAQRHPEWAAINGHVKQKTFEDLALSQYGLECVRPIEAHARLILAWRNDPDTRTASFHTELKPWDSFFPQFRRAYFAFPELPPFFVIENGQRVAFLRLEPVGHPAGLLRRCAKVSINVSPECRNKGIGRQSLLLAKEFLSSQGFDDIYAEIRVGNSASVKMFTHAGFLPLADAQIEVFETGESVSIHRLLAPLSLRHSEAPQHVYVIAEAGSNWRNGEGPLDFTLAKQLIEAASLAGADAIKFQVFRADTTYVPNAGQAGYLAKAGMEEEIGAIFKNITLPREVIPQLAAWAKEAGIDFLASTFSTEDFAAIDPHVSRHKIASYEIGHIRLLELAAKSNKPLIMSTGAANESEIAWSVDFLRKLGVTDLTLMQCTACYPAPPRSMNLKAIPWLKKRFKAAAGLSDHSADPLAAPLAAIALGATVIEKHFTLDRTFLGPDHKFAIMPDELALLVREVRQLEPMLGCEAKYVHDDELELRRFVRRGVQASCDIKAGEILHEGGNLSILRPGRQSQGVHPLFMQQIEGKAAKRDIALGTGIQHGDF